MGRRLAVRTRMVEADGIGSRDPAMGFAVLVGLYASGLAAVLEDETCRFIKEFDDPAEGASITYLATQQGASPIFNCLQSEFLHHGLPPVVLSPDHKLVVFSLDFHQENAP